ncbi:Na+/H+ antiporter [Ellagibacter isourolithinifaciens]|uniref:Na+/H+ antiporter n=1 Tax=Ellagibacter isourolithinifaciens TaxID=2137581 RepID=UPI003A93594F
METLTLVMLIFAAILASSIIDQVVPRVSSPLIQIGLGLLIALFASSQIRVTLDPELFLVLFIAPLLYEEAKSADKAALWHHKRPVLSLAIGLVVATTLAIGFAVHAVIPSIGLAAAFALGAALGPTDAVAVTSLSKQVNIPDRQGSILKGELLLNDASGIVSFQFAIAAAVTGSFSLLNATGNFFVEFLGGIAVGALLAYIGKFLVNKARSLGVENTTFHVLFEILIPLLVYSIADAVHVSGIIAVVVAGLINVISPHAIGPSISRMNIVSSSVWRVLTFALNGFVFVLLGTQLPQAMVHTWDDVTFSNFTLIGYVVALTLLLYVVRFAWVCASDWLYTCRRGKKHSEKFKLDLRKSLITTLAGAKGTITLSILFTIPYFMDGARFPQRDLIIFLGCGVIVCTLLVATFIVPLIAPKKVSESEEAAREREAELKIDILRSVVEELTARQTPDTRRATRSVVSSYNDRIERIKEQHGFDEDEDEAYSDLRIRAIGWERECVKKLAEQDDIDSEIALKYLKRLKHIEELRKHSSGRWSIQNIYLVLRTFLRRAKGVVLRYVSHMSSSPITAADQAAEMRKIQQKAGEFVIGRLNDMLADSDCNVPSEYVSKLLIEYQRTVAMLAAELAAPSATVIMRASDKAEDVKRLGYLLELEQIQSRYEEGELTRGEAKRMRDNTNLMLMDVEDSV